MISHAGINILIPLKYNCDDHVKDVFAHQNDTEIKEAQRKSIIDSGSEEWFRYCFRNKPIEKNYQMINSPLVSDSNYNIGRIELESYFRSSVGLHKNEKAVYELDKNGINIKIGKIRILFTKIGIAFLHFEVFASEITDIEAYTLINCFSHIGNSQPRIIFENRLYIDTIERTTVLFKDIVENILELQHYLHLFKYGDNITPFFQITLVGSCDEDNKYKFFDTIRNLSKRASSRDIDPSYIYNGIEDYVSRFVGDRTVCIFGDTSICDENDLYYLNDTANGLFKSATENYLTVFAYLITLHLLLHKIEATDSELSYLLNAPTYLSDEERIREFYLKCIWNSGWNISSHILKLTNNVHIKLNLNSTQEIQRIRELTEKRNTQIEKENDIYMNNIKTVWRSYEQISKLIMLLHSKTEFYSFASDSYEEARKRVIFLKHVIEDQDGYKFFYCDGKPIKRESDLQVIYRLIWYGSPMDVNREVNNGRGPVDYKVSFGKKNSTIIEFKLASNSKLRQNLIKQVEIYRVASDANHALKVILFFTEAEKNKVNSILNELDLSDDSDIILIDARKDNKPSASTAKLQQK